MKTNLYMEAAGLGLPQGVVLDNESIKTSVSTFLTSMAESLVTLYKRITLNDATIAGLSVVSESDCKKVFDNIDWQAARRLRCFTPSKMNGNMVNHLDVLNRQIEMLSDIEKRLIDPALKFCAEIISDNEALKAVWVDKDIAQLDTDRMKGDLTATFDPSKLSTDTPYESTYGDTYSNMRDIFAASRMLNTLVDNNKRFDLKRLSDKDKKLAEYVDEVADICRKVESKKETIAKLANVISSISVELEYISVAFYYLNANVHAFNESIEYTKRILESK